MTQNKHNNNSNRGFASMDSEKQRKIASEGGKAAHASGNAHVFTSEEAREAGRKGGLNSSAHSSSNNATQDNRNSNNDSYSSNSKNDK